MKKEMPKGELSPQRRLNMMAIAGHVVDVLGVKNPKYGESWKSKGGFSAFFNLDRKWSRVETLAAKYDYDIFAAIDATAGQPDGMIEALSDLMGYGMLILDDQCFVAEDPEHPEPGTAIVMKGISEAVDVSKEGLDANALRDGKIKCDGNHGGPPCQDRECWQREEPDVSPGLLNPDDDLKRLRMRHNYLVCCGQKINQPHALLCENYKQPRVIKRGGPEL